MLRSYIKDIDVYLPSKIVSNQDISDRLALNDYHLDPELLWKVMGSEYRREANENQISSDLASLAAKKVFLRQHAKEIDLLIYASASSDMVEPATANLVQQKLALQCPAFDVKNACNSMVNAMQIADSFITSGSYKNILIVSGEKPSVSIQYHNITPINIKDHFPAFSFGDAGAAIWMTVSPDDRGFYFHKHASFGQHWSLSTIKGGGTMHPRGDEHSYFTGDTFALRHAIQDVGVAFIRDAIEESGFKAEDIACVCTHQVSEHTFDVIADGIGIPQDKIIKTFKNYGNTASTAVAIALMTAIKTSKIKKGDLVLLLGLAAGVNISVQLMRY